MESLNFLDVVAVHGQWVMFHSNLHVVIDNAHLDTSCAADYYDSDSDGVRVCCKCRGNTHHGAL
jgi:hypothetical protein